MVFIMCSEQKQVFFEFWTEQIQFVARSRLYLEYYAKYLDFCAVCYAKYDYFCIVNYTLWKIYLENIARNYSELKLILLGALLMISIGMLV